MSVKTVGERIKDARKRIGIGQGALARRLRMTAAQLCRIEKSKNAPSLKTLARIARALGVALSSLMEDCSADLTVHDSSGDARAYAGGYMIASADGGLVPIRSTDDPPDDIEDIRRQVASVVAKYVELEASLGVSSATTLPTKFAFSEDERGADVLARSLRTVCGIGSAPYVDWPSLLEAKHVRIVQVKTSAEIQSRSFYDVSSQIVAIALNKGLPPERLLYRIAYELGYICIFGSTGMTTVVERSATHRFVKRFAEALLVPEEAIAEIMAQLALGPNNWTMELLLRLRCRFGVDAETFGRRLERIGALSPSLRRRFKEELRTYYEEHVERESPSHAMPLSVGLMLELLRLRVALTSEQ